MAITQSVIRVYDDSSKTTLVTSVTNSGPALSVDVSSLSAGSEYWATVQVTADGMTSEESPVYRFYTLPYVEFYGTMHTGPNWFSSELSFTTDVVGIDYGGIVWDTSSSFDNPTYCTYVAPHTTEVRVNGLDEDTTYYARAYVVDEFGRMWINPNTVTVATGDSLPTINWHGMSAVGATTWDSAVAVSSTTPITSIVCTYTATGGSAKTLNMTASTGVQQLQLTGLLPNTQYTVIVTATNAGGSASTSARVFTTNTASGTVSVEVTSTSIDNADNRISVTSEATYDSSVATITGHYIELYENDQHSGTAFESSAMGSVSTASQTLSHADPNETYYVFSRVTYTVGSDPTVYTAWSEPVEVMTYSLFSFTSVLTTDTTAEARYAVAGSFIGTEIQYSTDEVNWLPATSGGGDIREGITITNLTPETTYYLRGRCKSAAGWSAYDQTTFTTESGGGQSEYNVDITSVDSITDTTAIFTVTIS
jgi:hypothetical protein